jgi:hypothetical protein
MQDILGLGACFGLALLVCETISSNEHKVLFLVVS